MDKVDPQLEKNILKTIRNFQERSLDVLIIDGPAGSGKSTLVNRLLEKYGNEFLNREEGEHVSD